MPGQELRWSCRFCGHRLWTSRSHAGKQTKCPRCRQWLRIPLRGLTADELVERLTHDTEAGTRAAAAAELGRAGHRTATAALRLVEAGGTDPSALVRFRSLEALAQIVDQDDGPGTTQKRVITGLVNALTSNHSDAANDMQEFGSHPTDLIRRKAQAALMQMPRAAESFVSDAIRQYSPDAEQYAILSDVLEMLRGHQEH